MMHNCQLEYAGELRVINHPSIKEEGLKGQDKNPVPTHFLEWVIST